MKKHSTSLVAREMQTTMRYQFTLTRIAIKKKNKTVGKEIERLEPLYTAGGHIKQLAAVEIRGSSKS